MKLLAILLAGSVASLAVGAELKIEPREGSRFALEVEKTGFLRGKKHVFLFDRYSGRLTYNAERPEASQVELTIDSNSLRCIDTWIDEKDKKKVTKAALEDMLQAAKYPQMRFASNSIKALGDGRFEATGNLTIRDRTNPVVVTLTAKPGAGGGQALEGTSKFKMTLYGMKPPSAALGTVGTKDEMTVQFNVSAR